jgi:hypothetical protein
MDQAMNTAQNILKQATDAVNGAIQSDQAQNIIKQATDAVNGALGNATGLQTRKLGKNGPNVTAIGFGTMGLSAFYGKPKPDAERFAVLDAAYNKGELHWDSADM